MKYWAYKTQYCDDIVFAADIEAGKVARGLVGRWNSPKFYSDGNPGHRDVMFQRTNRGGSGGHFYYQSEDVARQRDGARETLSHALCKRAISELTCTEANAAVAKSLFIWRLVACALVLLAMMLLWLQFVSW